MRGGERMAGVLWCVCSSRPNLSGSEVRQACPGAVDRRPSVHQPDSHANPDDPLQLLGARWR